jgi:hypothetical protein
MALAAPISDGELIANSAAWAAAILADPLGRRLCWHTLWVLQAIAAEDLAVRPEDAVPVLRLALATVDAAEIQLGLEVAA